MPNFSRTTRGTRCAASQQRKHRPSLSVPTLRLVPSHTNSHWRPPLSSLPQSTTTPSPPPGFSEQLGQCGQPLDLLLLLLLLRLLLCLLCLLLLLRLALKRRQPRAQRCIAVHQLC